MKKAIALLLAALLALSALSGCANFATAQNGGDPTGTGATQPTDSSNPPDGNGGVQGDVTINVYNWGQYIAEGDEGSMDVIAEFETAYPNIHVNYTTYDSNETMYTKLKTGGISVDVIIPSDYMIARMIDENMLLELDFNNIPNYQYIDQAYRNTAYDPENKYSIPYTWGTVGIIYNTKYVDQSDVTGWELLWNQKYANKILMFGNSRDAFGIAEYLLGYDVNTTDQAQLQAAADKLAEQKPVVQQWVMDEIFDLMENEEAWIAPYYAGDYLLMADENEDLAFYLPEHQGFNFFIDAMCIPASCQNKEAAETFINFLCEPRIAGGNMDWIGYGTPETAAKEYMDPDMANSTIAYPSAETLAKGTTFLFLPAETNQLMEELWLQAKTD